MGGLTRAEILAADDLDLTPVEVPEWGGTVYVRSMTGKEHLAWERDIRARVVAQRTAAADTDDQALGDMLADQGVHVDLLVRCVCDENGELLFTADDIPALEAKAYTVLEPLIRAAAKASGIALDVEAPPLLTDVGNSSGGAGSTAPGSASP